MGTHGEGVVDSPYRAGFGARLRASPISAFAMNPVLASLQGSSVNYWPDWPNARSWAALPFYGPFFLAELGIAIWLRCR